MNIEKFNPKKDPKYNSFIYRFLKRYKKIIPHSGMPVIAKFDTLGIWRIGWHDTGGWFIGVPIGFSPGEKVEIYAFKPGGKVIEEVKWSDYQRIGGCALTNRHHKWVYANKQSRKCQHCGKWERKVVKTVKTVERRTLWESES